MTQKGIKNDRAAAFQILSTGYHKSAQHVSVTEIFFFFRSPLGLNLNPPYWLKQPVKQLYWLKFRLEMQQN